MKFPFLSELRRQFPESHITWVTGREITVFDTILQEMMAPYIDKVYSKTDLGLHKSRYSLAPWKQVLQVPYYDVIIDTSHKFSPTWMLRRYPHGVFVSRTWDFLFSDRRPQKTPKKNLLTTHGYPPSTGPEWAVRQFFELVTLIAPEPPLFNTTIPIPKKYVTLAEKTLRSLHNSSSNSKIVLLAVGSGKPEKCWPLENFIALHKGLEEQGAKPMVLLGPLEHAFRNQLVEAIPHCIFPLQTTDENSPFLTMALGRLADAAVANDAGIGHVLGASKVPLVSLFGPTHPEKYRPLGDDVTCLKAQDYSPHPASDPRSKNMGHIPAPLVLAEVVKKLSSCRPKYTPV